MYKVDRLWTDWKIVKKNSLSVQLKTTNLRGILQTFYTSDYY